MKEPIYFIPQNNYDFINRNQITLIDYNEVFVKVRDYIVDAKDFYWVSSHGRLYSEKSNKFLNPSYGRDYYLKVSLTCDNRVLTIGLHILVMVCFNPLDRDGLQVNHMDGDKEDNDICNLEYCTPMYNIQHSISTGLKPTCDNVSFATFTNEQVELICQGIQSGLSYKDIYSKLLGLDYKEERKKDPALSAKLTAIYKRKNWKDISMKYTFPEDYNARTTNLH